MRIMLVVIVLPVLLTACGPTQEDLLVTQMKITQTAEWSEKDHYVDCLSSVLDDAMLLEKASSACTSFECQRELSTQLDTLAEDLPTNCVLSDPCASPVQDALQKHVRNLAYLVHGPISGVSLLEKEKTIELLFDQVRFSFDAYIETLNSSCLRRNIAPLDD